jgi:hypothetical protein
LPRPAHVAIGQKIKRIQNQMRKEQAALDGCPDKSCAKCDQRGSRIRRLRKQMQETIARMEDVR